LSDGGRRWIGAGAAVLLLAAPFAVQAQPTARVPRIGFLVTGLLGSPEAKASLEVFRQGLREHGYVEGQNILIEYRGADGNIERGKRPQRSPSSSRLWAILSETAGGNLTGTTFLGPRLVPKHLELLKEALPRASRVAILWHPGAFAESTMSDMVKETEAAARTLSPRRPPRVPQLDALC
jgi:putative ABC transport system substrate-binding protein